MAFTRPTVLSLGASSPHCSQVRLGSSCSPLPLPGTCLSEFAFTVASAATGFLQLLSHSFHFMGQMLTCQNGLPWPPYLKHPPTLLLLLQRTYPHLVQQVLFLFLFVVFLRCQNVSTMKQELCFVFCHTTTSRTNVWPFKCALHLLEKVSNHQRKAFECSGSQCLTCFLFWALSWAGRDCDCRLESLGEHCVEQTHGSRNNHRAVTMRTKSCRGAATVGPIN